MSRNYYVTYALMSMVLVVASTLPAATRTVAKSGAAYTTVSAAITAAAPGDVIVIADSATYEEQVTIDSTKCPLTLTSSNPASLIKPTIRYRDTINVGPRTYAESQDVSKLTYDRNAALRVLKARNVIIEGIAIDGGGPFAFGYNAIWDRQSALQFGNSAIAVWECGGIIVRNCDIANAYFGISFKDRNVGGIFANPNSADLDTSLIIPMSRYGLMGNHLIERNRIHNNSFGIFSESSWDLGSTIRYNLIYENHHPTEAFATRVRNLTDDGIYHVGGAFMFKDIQLSPFAIYNNTFWHNFLIFSGHWQAGYQHLVFNNIFGVPHKYLGSADGVIELTSSLANRICNSIFSAQIEAPVPPVAIIMGSLHVTLVPDSGAGKLIEGFPAAANNRWLEMDSSKFLSISPASADFLEPNWADSGVQNFIKQKGWQESGIKNTDGSWADLGAIEQTHGTPSFVGTINPVPSPVTISGTAAQVTFALDERIGAMKDPVIRLMRLVKTKFKSGSFGCCENSLMIAASDIFTLAVPAAPPLQVGPNMYSITCPVVSGYAFIEMIVEATGADGKQFTLAPGFLPYRNLSYKLVVEIHDKNGSTPVLSVVHVGDTVQLRLLPQKMDGTLFWSPLNKVSVMLSSGFDLLVPGNPPTPLAYPSGLAGGPDSKLVIFTGAPASGIDYIAAGAEWKDTAGSVPVPFVGGSSIKVLPQSTAMTTSSHQPDFRQGDFQSSQVTVDCFDLQGRRIFQRSFFASNGGSLNLNGWLKNSSGRVAKAYILEVVVQDGLSGKQTRSMRKMVVR